MSGYVCLHVHYLPDIDDGVRDHDEGVALCRALKDVGYEALVATPHIRTAMFDNRKTDLEAAFSEFAARTAELDDMPELGLGAEHHLDDVVWELFEKKEAVPYPGGKAALIELPENRLPLGLAERFFRMRIMGVRPVLAHPERYRPFYDDTAPMDPLLDAGALPLLDVMSLVGRYGQAPQRAAERMVEEGTYFAACSDAHRPADADVVAAALERLTELVGEAEVGELCRDNPRHILAGTAEYD